MLDDRLSDVYSLPQQLLMPKLPHIQAQKKKLLELKRDNPHLRLRSKELLAATTKVLATVTSTGLKAPKSKFVELWAYTEKYGEPQQSDIVWEEFNGQRMAGVLTTSLSPCSRFECSTHCVCLAAG